MRANLFSPADLSLACAVGLALFALPPVIVPWPWLVGHALPGLVLVLSQRWRPQQPLAALGRNQRLHVGAAPTGEAQGRFTPWGFQPFAGVLAAVLTLLCVGAALRVVVPVTDAAPIACILVTPLTYFALRRSPIDRRYALFLALCLLVIASVLDVARARPCALAFAIFGTLMLAHDASALARQTRVFVGRPTAPWMQRARQMLAMTALCVLTGVSLFQLLSIAPVPDYRRHATAGGNPDRARGATPGLSTQFDLSAADGWLDTVRDLQAPALATVHCDDGTTPTDLYLRFTHFDLAGANRWATSKAMIYAQPERDGWTLFTPLPGARGRSYTVVREPLGNGHLLLPEGTWHVEGVNGLEGHADQGLLRERSPSDEALTYRAHTVAADRDLRIDLHATHLLSLPEALMGGDIAKLAEDYVRGVGDDATARAFALVRGLRRDYAYTRRDPTGPRRDVLHNFLFHARAGYCMHFASALAVMLRLQRIPCRIGAGLYGGRPDASRPGDRVYGEADAHAWVEVPCVSRGFVVFDATPEATRAALSRVERTDVPEPTTTSGAEQDVANATLPLWLLPALFLASLILLPLLRRPVALSVEHTRSTLPATHAARALLTRTLQRLAALGVSRGRHETLAALAARAVCVLDVDTHALASAFAAYEELRFGDAAFDSARAARLQAGVVAATAARPREPSGA